MGWRAFRRAAQARKSKDAILQQNPPLLKSSGKRRASITNHQPLWLKLRQPQEVTGSTMGCALIYGHHHPNLHHHPCPCMHLLCTHSLIHVCGLGPTLSSGSAQRRVKPIPGAVLHSAPLPREAHKPHLGSVAAKRSSTPHRGSCWAEGRAEGTETPAGDRYGPEHEV